MNYNGIEKTLINISSSYSGLYDQLDEIYVKNIICNNKCYGTVQTYVILIIIQILLKYGDEVHISKRLLFHNQSLNEDKWQLISSIYYMNNKIYECINDSPLMLNIPSNVL